jgi:WD40 repeat protein
MNAIPQTAARPLLDMLGARWRVGVAAASLAWDSRGECAGFALGDGTLALAPTSWEGGPVLQARNGGGVELVPATSQAPAVARLPAHRGACLSVAADPDGGFLTGGSDGRVVRVLADAEVRAIGHLDRPVSLVAAGLGGWRVCAVARTVHRFGGSSGRIEVADAVTSLAIDPGGARLAIGHAGGVTLWSGGDTPRVLDAPGTPSGVAWSPDGSWLGAFSPDGALHAWRMPQAAAVAVQGRIISLAAASDGFVAGADGRVLYWRPGADPTPCGVANQQAVTRVACHPRRMLIAAGYANGAVALCRPDTTALLLVRTAGEGAVTALGFSSRGDHLAIGTEGGEIAVVATPGVLFRDDTRVA